MEDQVIALFELTLEDDENRVVEERHYRLVPARALDRQAIRTYRYPPGMVLPRPHLYAGGRSAAFR